MHPISRERLLRACIKWGIAIGCPRASFLVAVKAWSNGGESCVCIQFPERVLALGGPNFPPKRFVRQFPELDETRHINLRFR